MSEASVLDTAPYPDPATTPIETLDVAKPEIFRDDAQFAFFKRMRDEDPVHFLPDSDYGPYWSMTRYEDIRFVDTNHKLFSSAGGISIGPLKSMAQEASQFQTPMFIAMDQPTHDVQRNTVTPVVAPRNLAQMEGLIRQRAGTILDSLPIGETFDWVDKVSIELTTQMLATLFDFPFEDRRKLTRWSDVATATPGSGVVENNDQRREELIECLQYFTRLWQERAEGEPGNDLISMMAHGEDTKHLQPMEFLGNLILLIVGGNDTTRNSISGGVLALNQHPDQYDKLRADTGLIPNMVSEIIRWQTPLTHMRRIATQDVEVGGKSIKAGDKVVMWYLSGNRDETVFDDPDGFNIERPNARSHLSFGFGIHRCMGNRLAEMQLRILWQEIMDRFEMVEVVGEAQRSLSTFVRGYTELPVRLHPRKA